MYIKMLFIIVIIYRHYNCTADNKNRKDINNNYLKRI